MMSDDLIRRSDVYKAVDDWLEGRVPNLNIKDIPSAEITADDVLEYCRPRLLTIVAEEALPSAVIGENENE